MTLSRSALGAGLGLFLSLVWGCASGGGGGSGSAQGLNNNGSATPTNANGGGSGNMTLPVIDCSGVAVLQTGVNLTPFYDEFPVVGLPGDLFIGERPAKLDLADDLPSPCHQGQLNSCVPWAIAYGMMTYYAKTRIEGWGDPDQVDKQFSPTFVFNQSNAFRMNRSRANSCTGAGTFISDAMAFIQEAGCALMSDMPYVNDGDCQVPPSKETGERATLYRVANYFRIEHDYKTMKTYLFEETPPVIVAKVGDPFMRLRGSTVYDRHDPEGGFAHAMLVIGYDDDLQAMMLLNSWGTGWGDGGYGWVSYDIWETFVTEAWLATPDFAQVSEELIIGPVITNPYTDSDGDGIPDATEVRLANRGYDYDRNRHDPDGPPNLDARPDADMDGWPDSVEQRFETDPNSFDEFPFMPGFEYPDGFFVQFDGSLGVLETDADLGLEPADEPSDSQTGPDADQDEDQDEDTEPEQPPEEPPPCADPEADADNDAIPDCRDLCPDTLVGSIVDSDGCRVQVE